MSATLVVVPSAALVRIGEDIDQIKVEIEQLEAEADMLRAEADALNPNFVLTLNRDTARALYHVLRHVGGHAGDTRRNDTEQIFRALARVFGYVSNEDVNDIEGAVTFARLVQ